LFFPAVLMLALSEKPIKPTTSTVPEEKPPKNPANPLNPLMEFEFEFQLKIVRHFLPDSDYE